MTARTFRLGCELTYSVAGTSAWIMNICVPENGAQKVLREELVVAPSVPVEESVSPVEEKRLHRFRAEGGEIAVRYSAEVEVVHFVNPATEIPEVPPADLPSGVVPYLYPSRYCESDMLVRMAAKEFGGLSSGFSRVTAVCNWIHDKRGVSARHH